MARSYDYSDLEELVERLDGFQMVLTHLVREESWVKAGEVVEKMELVLGLVREVLEVGDE